MSFTGRHVPEHLGGGGLGPIAAAIRRIVLAASATAACVFVDSAALLFITAPAWLSVLFEPFSLLLLPGLIAVILLTGSHDLDPALVLDASAVLYFLFFVGLFETFAWKRRQRRRRRSREIK